MLIKSMTLISNILSSFFPCKQNGKSASKASILFSYYWLCLYFHRSYLHLFTLYTLTAVCIFSILFSIKFQICWQWEFFQQSWASLFGDNNPLFFQPSRVLLLLGVNELTVVLETQRNLCRSEVICSLTKLSYRVPSCEIICISQRECRLLAGKLNWIHLREIKFLRDSKKRARLICCFKIYS